MGTEAIRQFKNELIIDNTLYATDYSPVFGAGRFEQMLLFVDATAVITAKSVAFNEVQVGEAGTKNTWVLNVGSADGGTFDIGIEDDMQINIAHNANAATIQTALRLITGDGWDEVAVAGTTPGDFTITMPFKLEAVALVADFDDLTEDGVAVSTTPSTLVEDDEFDAGQDTIHTYEVKSADGGTFNITSSEFTNLTSVAWNVTADTLKAAFVAADADFVDDVGEIGHVTVVKDGTKYTVTFTAYVVDGDEIATVPTSLTQTTFSLQIEVEVEQPFKADSFYTVKTSEDAHYFAAITATGKHSAIVPLNGDRYRLKYTITGVDKAAKLLVSAVVK